MSSLWVGMGRRWAAVPGNAQLRELPQPVGTPVGAAAHGGRGVVRPSPQPPEAGGGALAARQGFHVNTFQRRAHSMRDTVR